MTEYFNLHLKIHKRKDLPHQEAEKADLFHEREQSQDLQATHGAWLGQASQGAANSS